MRFVPGTDLAAEVRAARSGAQTVLPLPPANVQDLHEVLRFFEGVALALDAAHELGVVHRDVKPGNLMVRPDGEPVVLDFGLATGSEGEALTRVGEGMGTPEYMAPEQIEEGRGAVDARTDVYGLGVTLYEVLTGTRPFQGPSPHEIQASILRDATATVDRLNPALNGSVAAVVAVAMERDPARRYGSARDLAEDLRRLRAFEPIMARPPGPAVRVQRWAQRQPALAASLAGVFLAITAALLVALHGIDVRDGLIADKNDALREKTEALDFARSRLYLARAEERLEGNPSAALALAEYADRLHSTPESRSALFAPLLATRLERRFTAEGTGRVRSVAMSPDGSKVAGVADQDQLWIWPVGPEPGRRLDLPGDGKDLTVVRWLDNDGGQLVGSAGGTVHRVRGETLLWSSTGGPAVSSIEVDGTRALVWGEEGGRVLDLATGNHVEADGNEASHLALIRHRVELTARPGSTERFLQVRNSDGAVSLEIPCPPGEVTARVVSADGTRAAVALKPGRVLAWLVATGDILADETGEFIADSLSWTNRGRRLLMTTESRNAYLWRAEPLPELFEVREAGPGLLTAEFIGDGRRALLVDRSGRLQLIATPHRSRGVIGHSPGKILWEMELPRSLECASKIPPSGHLLTIDVRGKAALWRVDPEGDQLELEHTVNLGRTATASSLTADGTFGLFTCEDGSAHLWEPARGTLIEVDGSRQATSCCLLEGGRVALGQPDGQIRLLGDPTRHRPFDDPALLPPFDDPRLHPVLTMALSPDGRQLAACYSPTFVVTWNLETLEVVGRRVTVLRTDSLLWSNDCSQIAVGARVAGNTFKIINVATATASPRVLPIKAGLTSASFSTEDGLAVVGARDGRAYVFGAAPEAKLTFGLHSAAVNTVDLDTRGPVTRALSSDDDGGLYLWPLRPTPVASASLARGVDDWEQQRIDGSVSDG